MKKYSFTFCGVLFLAGICAFLATQSNACEKVYPFQQVAPLKIDAAYIDFDNLKRIFSLEETEFPKNQDCSSINMDEAGQYLLCVAEYVFSPDQVVRILVSNLGHEAVGNDDFLTLKDQKVYFDRMKVDGKYIDYFIAQGANDSEVVMFTVEGGGNLDEQQRLVRVWPSFFEEVYFCAS
ncbi:hypothetical protein [Roseobacter sp.]|uniref:hypothetical protein n=1 Tax=Roseobacter sp. TaxID=1907202 RepID=UPI002966B613|nr:hypothetical protein [Roseobacter sp.]MDW3181640.1 hypothetical protein [Roseobacter sp.]